MLECVFFAFLLIWLRKELRLVDDLFGVSWLAERGTLDVKLLALSPTMLSSLLWLTRQKDDRLSSILYCFRLSTMLRR